MERPLLFTKGLQESKEDYCGLELYLSPEKGEDTAITSDLITQEVRRFGEPETVTQCNCRSKSLIIRKESQ